MQTFDRIEILETNGFRELFAVNDEKNESYQLINPIVSSESSALTGYWVSVGSIRKRMSFSDEHSMKQFRDDLIKKIHELDIENHKKKYGPP